MNKNGAEKEHIQFDKDKAIYNPAVFFKSPNDLLQADKLNKSEKIQALKNWELDIRLNEIAVEENMPSFVNPRKNHVSLQDVHLALENLDVFLGSRGSPSKTGM